MFKRTITWRELSTPQKSGERQYEVYDSDTGTTIGVFDSREAAEHEVANMNESDVAGGDSRHRKQEADPGDG